MMQVIIPIHGKKYYSYAYQTAVSIMRYNPLFKISIALLYEPIDTHLQSLCNEYNIRLISINKSHDLLHGVIHHHQKLYMSRFLVIPDYIDLDRPILMIDGRDTLCLKTITLSEIAQQKLQNGLLAVVDQGIIRSEYMQGLPVFSKCRMPPITEWTYYNAGVLFFAPQVFIQLKDIYADYLKHEIECDMVNKLRIPDQDILNAIIFKELRDKFYVLPNEYNHMVAMPTNDTIIWHLAGREREPMNAYFNATIAANINWVCNEIISCTNQTLKKGG